MFRVAPPGKRVLNGGDQRSFGYVPYVNVEPVPGHMTAGISPTSEVSVIPLRLCAFASLRSFPAVWRDPRISR
jgi:hypothetical protein